MTAQSFTLQPDPTLNRRRAFGKAVVQRLSQAARAMRASGLGELLDVCGFSEQHIDVLTLLQKQLITPFPRLAIQVHWYIQKEHIFFRQWL